MHPYLVHHVLERSAQAHPERVFLLHAGDCATYGEVEAGANRVARLLVETGFRRGDRVGLLAHNSRFYVEAYYGILKAGAVAVPINTATDGPTLRHALADCGARALLAGPKFERPILEALPSLPELGLVVVPHPARLAAIPARVRAMATATIAEMADSPVAAAGIDLDLASIVYTSGSTGTPRGAMLTHLNLVTNTRAIVGYLDLTADDRVLVVLPFYYVYGKSLLNTHAAAGGSVVIENRFVYPATALDTLERDACTGLSGVPSTFAILLDKTNFHGRALPALRYMTQAGGAMAPETTRRLMAAQPAARLFVMYGATEAGARLTYLDPEYLPAKLGSIGRPIPNVDLRVLREDGTCCGHDEDGELVARGSTIMGGYWGAPDETARVLSTHGYHTGDIGRCDSDGFFWVTGRKKDMIKAGAHRIAAQEIEHAILEFPEVHEAAVIGVPDNILGEAIRAFVVFRGNPEESLPVLERFLQRRLPPFKVPSFVTPVPTLPKNEAGKVLKPLLRAQCGSPTT